MELSRRLQAVADLVSDGVSVADVGTDHGYIPIYLVRSGKCPKAIAMDVNRGPLLRAENHIQGYGLQGKIETRLSNGVAELQPYDYECVVVAGMGGALTVQILEQGYDVFKSLREFVLQPQSEIWKVRKYLCENQYHIVDEDMVFEDGKYYPMMKVVCGDAAAYNHIELQYGKCLLQKQHPILKQFLEVELQKQMLVLERLEFVQGEHIDERRKEILEKVEEIKDALQRFDTKN